MTSLAQQIFSEIYKQANLDARTGTGATTEDVRCVQVNGSYSPSINNATSTSLPNGIHIPRLAASISSTAGSSSPLLPNDLPSLILFFFSFSALREWLKLLVVGSALEMLRRVVFYAYRKIYESFFITALFEDDDSSYGS